jgi:hypothetical protein
VTIGFFPWRFVDGESSIGRCVAIVEDDEYEDLMAKKASLPKTRSAMPTTPSTSSALTTNLSQIWETWPDGRLNR